MKDPGPIAKMRYLVENVAGEEGGGPCPLDELSDELEDAHPELISEDSPSLRVGGEPADGFEKMVRRQQSR